MNRAVAPLVIAGLILLVLISGMFYQVDETEQVIITQFGRPVSEPITKPGLHAKVPFIQTVRRFDKRVLEWDGSAEQIPTLDKRFILLDTAARWRIVSPLRFLQSVGNERSAQSRLDDIIESAARDIVSGHLLIQVVRNFQRTLPEQALDDRGSERVREEAVKAAVAATPEGAKAESAETAAVVKESDLKERLGREHLSQLMVKRAQELLPNLGIELIDVRIKRINYVREVEEKVYERMISERQRIAARFRSEGDGASARIRGDMERELDLIQSEAYRQAQEIIGRGDAEAAGIYAAAYGGDAEFYSFLQTLETYKTTLQGNASLLLTTDSDFYRYLKGDGAGQDGSAPPSVAPAPQVIPMPQPVPVPNPTGTTN
ncbi:MAG: protease modulator HflC [Candidatus Tectomicrobia bacterium]|nr:protease modulator HflC [Candidatus Tectomicrobia bacterium]